MFTYDPDARRRLKVLAALWGVFFVVVLGLSVWLIQRVQEIESQTYPKLAQPCWSENEEQVAYLAREPKDASWSLWRVESVSGKSFPVCALEAGDWKLEGWLDDDRRLLLRSVQGGSPRVLVVEVGTGNQKDIRFEAKDIQFIGVRGGKVLFQRYAQTGSAGELPESLTVLAWSPGEERLESLVTIPFETERLSVEKAWPSLNNRWLALCMLMGDSGERTLWFFDQQENHLRWSGLRLACNGIRGCWSSDSSGFVAAIHSEKGCDLYAYYNIYNDEYSRLSAGDQSRDYQPFWPRGADYFLLLEKKHVYQFDPHTLEANKLTADGWDHPRTRDLAVSPRGNLAAYVGEEMGDDQLFKVDFGAHQSRPMLPSHPKAHLQQTWWFVLGQGLRTPWEFLQGAH